MPVLVDGSQAAVHMPVDVADIGCDFYAITGHKLYGPTGSGALYVRRERLAEMRPFLGGGDMIREVRKEAISYADPPLKFEAGTPGIVATIGLGRRARLHDRRSGWRTSPRTSGACATMPSARLRGAELAEHPGDSAGQGRDLLLHAGGQAHAHDISTVVDRKGVAVRAGHHCAQPLMTHLGLTATCRASFGLYNTTEEVDVLVDALETCHELFA